MEFDALLSVAAKKQQELRHGAKPFSAVSLSLPAPKKLERKQVNSSAVRKLLEEKKSRPVATAAGSSQAAIAAVAAHPATSTQKERLGGAALAAARGSATSGRPSSDSLRGDRDSSSTANGTLAGSSADVSVQRKALPSSRPGSSGSSSKALSCKNTSTAGASPDVPRTASGDRPARERPPSTASKTAVAASATGGGSSTDKKAKVSQPPSTRLSFSELMQLAAAKAADPAVATNVAAAGASASTTVATAVSSRPQPQQHRDRTTSSSQAPAAGRASASAAPATNGKPKPSVALVAAPICSGSNGSATVAQQQQQQRKRRGKLPPELMDLLDIRDGGQGKNSSSSGPVDKAPAKGKEKSSTSTATDSNAAAPKKSGKAGVATASKAAVGGGTPTPQEPPKPRGIPKAQLAVAVLQKRKEAASAAARELARQSADDGAEPAKFNKPRAETSASPAGGHRSSGSAAQAGSQRNLNAQHSSTSAASRPEKSAAVVNSKSTPKRDDDTNLSVWDRIVGKSKAAHKPKDSRKRRMIESDDDEYDEEMDDFIDDGDDYGQRNDISAEIKRIFGYDRSKFQDDDDDDADMEARFADVMKEEARSARIGREEDLEDMRMEEENKKTKKRKKHGR